MEWIEQVLLKYVNEDLTKKINNDFINFVNSKSQKDQVLFYFKFENYLKNSLISEIFTEYQIKTITQRLINSNLIEIVDKEGKEHIYSLTNIGEKYIDKKIYSFLDKNYDYKDYLIKVRKNKFKESESENVKLIADCLFEAQIHLNEHDKLIINLKELSEIDPSVVDLIYDDFKSTFQIIKDIYKKDNNTELNNEDIIFLNPHESEFREIHTFDREFKGLVYTKGLITSKKESIVSKSLLYYYKCVNPSCNFYEDFIIANKEIKKCPKCKSALELIKEERINQLESKITDVNTGISFPILIRNDLCKQFATVELGDEIEVIGYLEDKIIENKNNSKEITKALVINSFKTTDYVKELTKEEIHEVEMTLSKYDNYSDYLLKPFVEYIEDVKIKKLFIIQQLTRWNPFKKETPIHIAFMGEPGVGKNVLIKTAEIYFPNSDSIVGADITDAGFKGTVNRESGIKEVGLAKKCQNGTLFFNEFDKFVKSNPNGKKGASQLLNASITEQEIRLNKAGIRIRMSNLDLRHNIIFNPLDEKKVNEDKIPYDHMSEILDKSLLSRMLPLYVNKDNDRSKKVFNLMLNNEGSKYEVEPNNYQLVIRYLRNIDVIFTDKAKDLLENIYCEFLKSDKFQAISVERIGLMLTQITKGITRMHGKTKAGLQEVKSAHEIYMFALESVGITMDNLELLFLEKNIDDLREINIVKEYIIKNIDENKSLNIEPLFNLMGNIKEENINEAITVLKSNGYYIELPKGVLKKNG